ncbi:diaminopimelate epimerase [Occallatibacter riparius]|uniref:Diaminopimelate epimerase n=1 Tax=Occallatibacter riparius TaxID=1002689 RepID=A0A9J7BT99_9BACT|nr:diaminopimelate epimerase [Occallatibacter riparius]UWZ84237.1 diaminopimelate epimerase [Occallatibacter riparius]
MIPFIKAHACGNDFLIVTEDAATGRDWAELTRKLCERNTGVGADGVEFFAWTNESGPGPKSGRIRLHNSDGSIAEISGNGTRCVAAWMAEATNARAGDSLEIETDAGLRVCHVNAVNHAGEFTVDITTGMGVPLFARRTVTIPGGVQVEGVEVSTGNPHFVIIVDNPDFEVDGQRWPSIGQQICGHPDFPHQTNIEFVRILSASEIEIRIFERGVGPTTSSGTGTSASATAAIALHGCTSPLRVIAPGGAQTVLWNGPDTEMHLTGPAALIARGEAW